MLGKRCLKKRKHIAKIQLKLYKRHYKGSVKLKYSNENLIKNY